MSACVADLPELRHEAELATVAGLGDAVVFRHEGDAPDAPPPGMAPADASPTLSLVEAVQRAVSTDAGLQAALARVQMARAEAEQARTLPNPAFEFVLRWGKRQNQIEMSIAQSLLAVLQRPWRAEIADDALRAAAEQALAFGLDVVHAIGACYAKVQAADLRVQQLTAQLALFDDVVAVAESRVAHGLAGRDELDGLAAERLRTTVELGSAQRQQRELRLELARRIGEPSGAAAWQLDVWCAPTADGTRAADERGWLEAAFANRPELRALRWQLAALDDEHSLAWWAPWQDAAIGANVQKQPTWIGGPVLSVPVPLFDRGEATAERVTAEQSEVRHRLTECSRLVIEDVRNAYASFVLLQQDVERVRSQLLPTLVARHQRLEAARRHGQVDTTAVLDVRQQQLQAEAQALSLELEATLALLRLQRAAATTQPVADPTSRNTPDDGAEER
ncbi:MAG: TolC family protein [Planctomycetota bacterium]